MFVNFSLFNQFDITYPLFPPKSFRSPFKLQTVSYNMTYWQLLFLFSSNCLCCVTSVISSILCIYTYIILIIPIIFTGFIIQKWIHDYLGSSLPNYWVLCQKTVLIFFYFRVSCLKTVSIFLGYPVFNPWIAKSLFLNLQ